MTDATMTCFGFDDHLVRVIMQSDDPWFVAADVCRVLGIKNPTQVVARLDEDEKGYTLNIVPPYEIHRPPYAQHRELDEDERDDVGISDAIGRQQRTLTISESGLYTIVLRSHGATTPGTIAHRFRRWVTSEVLPQIRKTGQYAPSVGSDNRCQTVAEERLKLDKLHYCLRGFGPVAMRALWKELGLDWVPEMELADRVTGRRAMQKDNYDRVLNCIAERSPVSQRDLKRKLKNISGTELTSIIKALEAAGQVRSLRKVPPSGGAVSIIYEYIGDDTVITLATPTPSDLN